MRRLNKLIAVCLISAVRIAASVSFNWNRASIYGRYWWIFTKTVMENSLRGKRAQIVVVQEFVNGKGQLMNNQLTQAERKHLASVKELPCGVCGVAAPSEAHHIEQHQQYLCIPLCADCHRGSFNGIHGQQRIWKVMKKTESTVLNDTIKKLMEGK